jgi:two-component system KDP operon response regulator KdpE
VQPAVDKKALILVIDDEDPIRRLLRGCLERNGYSMLEASTGEEGIEEAIGRHPDAVLLDMELPDMDGLDVLKRLREWSQAPVLAVSERDDEADMICALDNGANDYVTKPFSVPGLLARLRAAQRCAPPPRAEVFRCAGLSVDLTRRTVKVRSRKVRLTATEYSLLRLFVRHAGKVLTHAQILREIWGPEVGDNKGYLRVYLTYLREKLEADPAEPRLLITEPGVGYRLAFPE